MNRKCYNCIKKLDRHDFLWTNDLDLSIKELKKIWNDKRIVMLCCKCYNELLFKIIYGNDKPEKLRKFFN